MLYAERIHGVRLLITLPCRQNMSYAGKIHGVRLLVVALAVFLLPTPLLF